MTRSRRWCVHQWRKNVKSSRRCKCVLAQYLVQYFSYLRVGGTCSHICMVKGECIALCLCTRPCVCVCVCVRDLQSLSAVQQQAQTSHVPQFQYFCLIYIYIYIHTHTHTDIHAHIRTYIHIKFPFSKVQTNPSQWPCGYSIPGVTGSNPSGSVDVLLCVV